MESCPETQTRSDYKGFRIIEGSDYRVFTVVGIFMVNGSSIKSCCDVVVKHHYFSINKNSSGVYNIIDFCQQGTWIQGYKDIVILSLMEDDGQLFKGEKMALRIFTNIGGNMRWDLAALLVSSGLV